MKRRNKKPRPVDGGSESLIKRLLCPRDSLSFSTLDALPYPSLPLPLPLPLYCTALALFLLECLEPSSAAASGWCLLLTFFLSLLPIDFRSTNYAIVVCSTSQIPNLKETSQLHFYFLLILLLHLRTFSQNPRSTTMHLLHRRDPTPASIKWHNKVNAASPLSFSPPELRN